MKNSFMRGLLAAIALPAFIVTAAFTGCSSESSGGGDSDTGAVDAITSFDVDPVSTELEPGSSATFKANAKATGNSEVTYSWMISEGEAYADLSATTGESVTLTAKNSDTESHTVKLTVTAKCGSDSKTEEAYINVKASKEGATPLLKAVAITGTTEISSDGEGELTATPSGDYLTGAKITYSWEITSEGSYASINGEGASVTIKGANTTETEQSVTVKVTAKLGETSVEKEYTVKVAAKGAVINNELTGVVASAVEDTLAFDGSTTLTAEPIVTGNPTITYTWKIDEGADYAALSATTGKSVTLTAKNSDSESHTVKVTVTASDGASSLSDDVSVTVNADATPVLSSVAISGETSIAAAGSTALTATPAGKNLENASITYTWSVASGRDFASISGSGASVTLTGKNTTKAEQTVTVKVTAKLGETSVEKEYTVKVAAKAESGSTDKTGNVSIDVAITDETEYFTVEFVDAKEEGYTSKETKTYKVKSGEKVTAPKWERGGYLLTWTSSGDGISTDSAITADVAFTASWTKTVYYTVTFKDSDGTNADDVQNIALGSNAEVPSWTKENYTLSWSSSVDGLSTDSAITADVTFTTVWTENAKYTVTFVDSDGTNTTVTQTVYEGKTATVPDWTKEGFNLTWTSSVSGLTSTSAITANVTFTATWSKDATSWTAGDATTPSWISGLGSVASNSRDAFKTQNGGTQFKYNVAIKDKGTFTITPSVAGTYVIYICRDDNNKTGTVTAASGGTTLGTYNTTTRGTSDITPWSLAVTSDYIGKAITFTVSGKALLFKVDIQ